MVLSRRVYRKYLLLYHFCVMQGHPMDSEESVWPSFPVGEQGLLTTSVVWKPGSEQILDLTDEIEGHLDFVLERLGFEENKSKDVGS